MARDPLLTFTPQGIFCAAGGFHIDPWQPVDSRVVTTPPPAVAVPS